MSAQAVDLRWNAPIMRLYGVPEGRDPRRLGGTMALSRATREHLVDRKGYPVEWSRCPVCKGTRKQDGITTREEMFTCEYCAGGGSIKDLIRELAGHRCIRCQHPFEVGVSGVSVRAPEPDSVEEIASLTLFEREPLDGEAPVTREKSMNLSPCDVQCSHRGPIYTGLGDELELRRGYSAGDLVFDLQLRDDQVETPVWAAWRILTVHHANGDKLDCRWFNLLALCQRCHLSVQSRVIMDRVWPHEHSAWFRPYVAAFYAWRYEGREVTRAEAVERMDELLAYERQT